MRPTVVLAAVVTLGRAAQAADLIVDTPTGVVETASGSWDGAFVGVFAGHGWGTADRVDGDYSLDVSGWLVGVDLGYNAYLTDGIVAGVVADAAWSGIGGADDIVGLRADIDWTASLRGRLGFDGGAFLPYLTAGLAVVGTSVDYLGTTDSVTHVGWTVGAGVEFAVNDDVSLDLLYRYSDYGEESYLGGASIYEATAHTIQAGLHWNF